MVVVEWNGVGAVLESFPLEWYGLFPLDAGMSGVFDRGVRGLFMLEWWRAGIIL